MLSSPGDKGMAQLNGLEEISERIAGHKLIPFLGAGISRPQLGFAATGLRDLLSAVMKKEPPINADLARVADLLEQEGDSSAVVAELKKHLQRDELDDALVTSHLLVFSLDCGLIYTTNQDNLFELAARKYGRPHRTVVTLSDLADARPGERLFFKFHGDPAVPSSLVFTQSSYDRRIAGPDNFLDIRLRSDLLGRGLLFIGYSLQDENMRGLMRQICRAFHGGTPESFLIAFDYQPGLDELMAEFNVKIVNPRTLFPDATNNATAFERCLQTLSNRVVQIKTAKALDSVFSDPMPSRILIEHELVALEQAAREADVTMGLNAFRASIDIVQIPAHLQRRVAEVVMVIAEKIRTTEELGALKAALFNVFVTAEHALLAMAGYMTASNVRSPSTGFDGGYGIVSSCMSEGMWPIAAAHAIEMLQRGGYTVSDGFRQWAMHWFEDLSHLTDPTRAWVVARIEDAWRGSREESPIARAERLGPLASPFRRNNFHEIVSGVTAWVQPVVATPLWADRRYSSNASAGVFHPRVLRGLVLRASATAWRAFLLCALRSVPFGKYWRSNPLVFSFVPRCHGLCGSQK